MRKNLNLFITALSLSVALASPLRLAGQEPKEEKKEHRHYKMVVIEPLGGPGSGASGPGLRVLNNRGTFAAISNTAAANPNPSCFVAFNNGSPDCFVEHPAVWHNGVLTDLGVLPGGANGSPSWISANGLIVGYSENGLMDPFTGQPEGIAVLWAGGKVIDLGTLAGGTESLAVAVNSRGQIAGFSSNDIPDAFSFLSILGITPGFPMQTRAFLWQNRVIRDLGTLGGPDAFVGGMNESGQIFGMSYTNSTPNPTTGLPTQDPFLWENGKMWDIGNLGGTSGVSLFINNMGQVVGNSNLAGDQTQHAFIWDKRQGLKDLGVLPGGTFSGANWINDSGEVVGAGDDAVKMNGILWKNGAIVKLDVLPGDCNSEALSINSRGQIVGHSSPDCVVDGNAVLWENGLPPVNLNTLVVPESDVAAVYPVQINDRGEIAAHGFTSSGDGRGVLLIPCDEDHPGIQGCDYDPVEAVTEAPIRSAHIGTAPAAASATKLSPTEMLKRRRHRFGKP